MLDEGPCAGVMIGACDSMGAIEADVKCCGMI